MYIGIIGVGNIGSIFVERLKETNENHIIIYDRNTLRTDVFKKESEIEVANCIGEVVDNSELILIAVKPQDAKELLKELRKIDVREKILVSTITGVTTEKIKEISGATYIARIMPNVPAAIGKGVTGLHLDNTLDKEMQKKVITLLRKLGEVVEIEENHFAAVTALSGSGPAFVFVIVESLIDIGLKMGLSYEKARELIIDTLIGSGELLKAKGSHPGEFRHLVTSPAGTTIEGIYSLERDAFRGTIMKALFDTYTKAKDLSEEIKSSY
ncbi:MAG: pyrroline-5-carboxylate reductase [Kosmotoga sp.]|nr:MAG: pyrroline-5-carboxylate reductase [Kosmotoga sp.]